MNKPSVGRIVHYVFDGLHLPAMITRVWSDICVNLIVFSDGSTSLGMEVVFQKTSVLYDVTGMQAEHWHWPEIVDQK